VDTPAVADGCVATIGNDIGTRKLFLAIHPIGRRYPGCGIRLRMIRDLELASTGKP
jgi:hypothetical protein